MQVPSKEWRCIEEKVNRYIIDELKFTFDDSDKEDWKRNFEK